LNIFYKRPRNTSKFSASTPPVWPPPQSWRERFQRQSALPIERRAWIAVIWLLDGLPVGFSTSDKIVYGEQANMHLHVTDPERRNQGVGAECMRRSADINFERLRLKWLFCEPNVAPNRALQKAGFKYLKTHITVPRPLNHQAVTCWVIER
jgi:RimJ/RimL family protein N-acetyltransferase